MFTAEDVEWLMAEIRRRGPAVEHDIERIKRAALALCDITPFAAQHGVDPEALADALALILTTKAEFVPGPRPAATPDRVPVNRLTSV